MRKIKSLLLLIAACTVALFAHAEGTPGTVSTPIYLNADFAKGSDLRPLSRELVVMVRDRQFTEADQKAIELRKKYEAIFDTSLRQYTFQSKDEFQEFSKSAAGKFEWIDWGYKECLQMQAFIASERRDFATALTILKYIEQVAPISAGTAAETGYIYNQLGKPAEGLSAYRRAHALSVKYASQRPYRAAALRGIGFALIELKQLDEAEKTFRESLEIEPGNKVALSELAYISNLRGAK